MAHQRAGPPVGSGPLGAPLAESAQYQGVRFGVSDDV